MTEPEPLTREQLEREIANIETLGENEDSFLLTKLHTALAYLDRAEAAERKVDALLMAVATKYPNETRYETALRYIHEAENRPAGCAQETKHDAGT